MEPLAKTSVHRPRIDDDYEVGGDGRRIILAEIGVALMTFIPFLLLTLFVLNAGQAAQDDTNTKTAKTASIATQIIAAGFAQDDDESTSPQDAVDAQNVLNKQHFEEGWLSVELVTSLHTLDNGDLCVVTSYGDGQAQVYGADNVEECRSKG